MAPLDNASRDKNKVLKEKELPTEMVDVRLAFNGLCYPDELCWQVFVIIGFIYSILAIPDNFIWRGGKLLCKFVMGCYTIWICRDCFIPSMVVITKRLNFLGRMQCLHFNNC